MKRPVFLFAVALILCTSVAMSVPAKNHIASLFTDNMVLQQQRTVPVWGTGTAGAQVSLRASWGKAAVTTIDSSGAWHVGLVTPKAGGPYTLEIVIGDSLATLRDVMVGEVWLCSGQSNMEMPVQGWPPTAFVDSSALEIRNAMTSDIRLFAVPRAASLLPLADCDGRWVECSPSTIPGFSATAYFFGRSLYQKLHVPIGLIHSSWEERLPRPGQGWIRWGILAISIRRSRRLSRQGIAWAFSTIGSHSSRSSTSGGISPRPDGSGCNSETTRAHHPGFLTLPGAR